MGLLIRKLQVQSVSGGARGISKLFSMNMLVRVMTSRNMVAITCHRQITEIPLGLLNPIRNINKIIICNICICLFVPFDDNVVKFSDYSRRKGIEN